MRTRRSAVLTAFLLPTLFAQTTPAPSHAVVALAFGLQVFVRPHGAPVVETRQFGRALLSGPFTLVVVNGEPGDDRRREDRVSNATITLNGAVMFTAADFQRAVLQKPVTLLPQNTLTVELEGAPGGFLIIGIGGYTYQFAGDYAALQVPGHTIPNDDIDWRSKGAVTPVKSEGSCPADWAFSATGVVEGFWFISGHGLFSLSEQQLIDCNPAVKNCSDGSPARALSYLAQVSATGGGADTEESYPYTAVRGTCKTTVTPAARISSVERLVPGSEAALQAALEKGPVSVVINGNWFSTYTSGVANPNCDGPAPPEYRAVLVVGFISGPTPAYIVKNSLGTSWGNQGYFQIVAGTNKCGIADFAAIPQ